MQSAGYDVMPELTRHRFLMLMVIFATILYCIDTKYVCNRKPNCLDGQDEVDCRELTTLHRLRYFANDE
jgi:hypothetical protein